MQQMLAEAAGSRSLWPRWTASSANVETGKPEDEKDFAAILLPFAQTLQIKAFALTLHHFNSPDSALLYSWGITQSSHHLLTQAVHLAGELHRRGPDGTDQQIEQAFLSHADGRSGVRSLRIPFTSRSSRTQIVLSGIYCGGAVPAAPVIAKALRQWIPVFDAYLRLWQRSRTSLRLAEGLNTALDLVSYGVILIDKDASLGFVNDAAKAMLRAGTIVSKAGRSLTTALFGDAMKLQLALSRAVAANSGAEGESVSAMLRLRGKGGKSLIVTVASCLKPADEPGAAAAVVMLLDPACDMVGLLVPVGKLYGLSPVESQLASLLAAGEPLHDVAERMHIKEQTARSYLKQIFLKTGTRRQADLVRVMLCSLPQTKVNSTAEIF